MTQKNKIIKYVVLSILITIVCSAIIISSIVLIVPKYRLNLATEFIKAKKYETAYNLIKGMNYENSSQKAEECLFIVQKSRISKVKVGSTIRFGAYEQDNDLSNGKEEIEWIVLEVNDNKALVISKYALDYQPFNVPINNYAISTWSRSSLRRWLNNTFFETAFSINHQAMIINSTVSSDHNPDYELDPGTETIDNIFILSIDEANKYFGSGKERQCLGTEYCYALGATKGENNACTWWLRTPGIDFYTDAVVTPSGDVFTPGFCSNNLEPAVRPAMWINLNPNE